ncbi:acetyl esterase/lipase [Paraburkholderia sp. RAU6.4a]|uniref:alpha/beta hydrolase n=1 Tax=unclassified Paraburkholderia TaxID=2615204 RepID=UPI00160F4A75|nr:MULTISPECIES: alpha/beta hydrolase [unclassified Paraburkholderia]MBB5412976.1 triacylglycerol lipase [Paraburkholderia sp. HC6.4b]MBB5455041.1 triacylglycerol lipase [Paraburkholderia sp. Kb1A]
MQTTFRNAVLRKTMSNLRIEAAPPLAPEYLAEIRRIPRTLSPESFQASLTLCAPLHSRDVGAACSTVTPDLRYGPDDRHCLDLYRTVDAAGPSQPLVLFVHGGGFVGGNRRIPGSYLYSNVAAWANSHGFAAALMSYRLAPAAQWPAGAEDIERAIDWLAMHSGQLGISTEQLIVIGHSAGATHLASWLSGHHGRIPDSSALRGAVLISGIFAPSLLPFQGAFAYYGDDLTPGRYSTVNGIGATEAPLLLVAAELDPPEFISQWKTVVSARTSTPGAKTTTFLIPDQNHFTSVQHLGVDSDDLGVEMATFVQACVKTSY